MARAAAGAGWRARTQASVPYLFVLPFFLSFAAFGLFPMAYALVLSFTRWSGAGRPRFLGLSNYTFLLGNPEFWASLAVSALLWLLIVPAQLVGGLLLAVALNNRFLRGRAGLRAAFIVPFVTPLVAMAQVWRIVFDDTYGPVNQVLTSLGLPAVSWLTSERWAPFTLSLLFLWKTTGFVMIILLSGLQEIPSEVYEAGSVDGASSTRQLLHLTLPMMRRPLVFVMVIQTLAVVQMFAEPFVVTQGGPYGSTITAGLYLYQHIRISDLGTGAANSILLVVGMLALSLGAARLLKENH